MPVFRHLRFPLISIQFFDSLSHSQTLFFSTLFFLLVVGWDVCYKILGTGTLAHRPGKHMRYIVDLVNFRTLSVPNDTETRATGTKRGTTMTVTERKLCAPKRLCREEKPPVFQNYMCNSAKSRNVLFARETERGTQRKEVRRTEKNINSPNGKNKNK